MDAYIVTHYPKISKYFGLYLDLVFHVFFNRYQVLATTVQVPILDEWTEIGIS
jgi:hypothetical protein